MNKDLSTLVAAKTIKTVTFIMKNPAGFDGYVTVKVAASYKDSEESIIFQGENFYMRIPNANAEIVSTGDRHVWVKIKDNRDEMQICW